LNEREGVHSKALPRSLPNETNRDCRYRMRSAVTAFSSDGFGRFELGAQHGLFGWVAGDVQRRGIQMHSGTHLTDWLGAADCAGIMAAGERKSWTYAHTNSKADTHANAGSDARAAAADRKSGVRPLHRYEPVEQ